MPIKYKRMPARQDDATGLYTCMVFEDKVNGRPLLEAWGTTAKLAEDTAKVLTVLWQAARPGDFKVDYGSIDDLIKSL